MKKFLFLFSAIAFIILHLSCSKKTKDQVNQATEFDINYNTSLSVPSNTMSLNAPIDFTTPDVPTQSNAKFLENKTAADLVDEIKFTKFNISTGTGNLDFLKSLSIYVKASGVGEQLVATKNPVPTGATSISLDLTDVNIKNFIFQPNIQFRVTVTIDASTLSGQNLSFDETVHVKATVLK